jgi:hypothetical protein
MAWLEPGPISDVPGLILRDHSSARLHPTLFGGIGRAGALAQDILTSGDRSCATIHLRVCTRPLFGGKVEPAP